MADDIDPAEFAEQVAAFDVDQFLVAASSTLASLAYAKLERSELEQAKHAIDALAALLPHVGGALKADLSSALTGLQVAYADAASGRSL